MTDTAAFDALIGLAQVATGLVGFSALVLAVTGDSRPLTAHERFRLREMIQAGLAVVALAFVPVALSLFGVSGGWLWRIASGLHLANMVAAFPLIQRSVAQNPGQRNHAVVILFFATVALLQLSNLVGWPWSSSGGPFFAALLIALSGSASNFTRLLMPRL